MKMDLVKAGASVAGNRQYREWVKSLKSKIRRAQAKAAVRVNEELMRLYWEMGRDIAEKRMEAEYGSGFFGSLSKDLKQEFPNMEGFSVSNLKYIKRFYLFYAASDRIGRKEGIGGSSNRQQPVDDLKNLFLVPWGHNIEIFTHAKSVDEALFYVCKTEEASCCRVCAKVVDAALGRVGVQVDETSAARLQVVASVGQGYRSAIGGEEPRGTETQRTAKGAAFTTHRKRRATDCGCEERSREMKKRIVTFLSTAPILAITRFDMSAANVV